jgi:aspartyl-tRNA synthetase
MADKTKAKASDSDSQLEPGVDTKPDLKPNHFRTHTCCSLGIDDVGAEVRLSGWVRSVREHGTALFVDLRDRWGITQIVFNPEDDAELRERASDLRKEWVIRVTGVVDPRGEGRENLKLPTGRIEIRAVTLDVLTKAQTPPLEIRDYIETNEELRLKYRYLDLRRLTMQRVMETRAKAVTAIRSALDNEGFIEIETPMFGRSTPEGARDFLVPARLDPGKFFALPQSPQMYKQLLMVAGVDRYYQIARCMRDEDLRADRQFEFTQLDLEMSFATQDDVLSVAERAVAAAFKAAIGHELPLPLARRTHKEIMDRYGSDRPDLRFELPLGDLTEMARTCGFKVFSKTVEGGGVVKGLAVPTWAKKSRGKIDKLTADCQALGAKGLAWMRFANGKLESNIVKMFNEEEQMTIVSTLGAEDGSLLLFQSGPKADVNKVLAYLRDRAGEELGLKKPGEFNAYYVVDFPAFMHSAEEGRWTSEHHPFTGLVEEDMPLLDSGNLDDLAAVRSTSYDMVINGYEVASGSVRIHDSETQKKVFEVLQLSEEDITERFGFFLEALRYGTPPHAGIAPGIDRLVMLMVGASSIREVIPFPKSQRGGDLMTGAPSTIDKEQLVALRLRVLEPPQKTPEETPEA